MSNHHDNSPYYDREEHDLDYNEPTVANGTPKNVAPMQKTHPTRNKMIVIGVIVLVVIIVVVIIVVINSSDSSDETTPANTTTPTGTTGTTANTTTPANTTGTTTGSTTPAGTTGTAANTSTPPNSAKPRRTTVVDCGYVESPRGWVDLEGGTAYCRYVGGSATEEPWWSCALANETSEYSDKGVYKYEDHKSKLTALKPGDLPQCSVRPTSVTDCGYEEKQQGWMALDKPGQFTNYCRYVGNSIPESYWSCTKPDPNNSKEILPYTDKGSISVPDFKDPNKFHPLKHGELPKCAVRRTVLNDCGYKEKPRGWFDLDGDGLYDDFCRFVGNSVPESWWSCTKNTDPNDKLSEKGKYAYTDNPRPYNGGITSCP